MKEKVYVDRLFADYEDTPEIRDFKEEIAGNLKERVRELMSKGLSEEEAFEKATAELGDISAIADDVGKRRRNEAIGQMYMGTKVPLTKRTAIGLTIASGFLLASLGLDIMTFFSEEGNVLFYYISALLFADAIGLFVFFGLTQETASHYPMKTKRALIYGVASAFVVMGVCLACVAYFFDGWDLSTAIGMETAFLLPSVCTLVFLGMTETDRKKPWLKAMVEKEFLSELDFEFDNVDPVKAARFGVASGGLWIFAVAVFICIGLFFTWQYAWLVFLFALGLQVVMVSTIFGKNNAA